MGLHKSNLVRNLMFSWTRNCLPHALLDSLSSTSCVPSEALSPGLYSRQRCWSVQQMTLWQSHVPYLPQVRFLAVEYVWMIWGFNSPWRIPLVIPVSPSHHLWHHSSGKRVNSGLLWTPLKSDIRSLTSDIDGSEKSRVQFQRSPESREVQRSEVS